MNFLFMITVTFLTTGTAKHAKSSSEESIENILYYKDCSHKNKKESARQPIRHEETTQRPQCVPRMCCSMSCDNTCGQDQSMISRQMGSQKQLPIQSNQPPPPLQTPNLNQRPRKKKTMQKPIEGRRNMGFTKEHIKSLISQDDDIKKILKDLVRVTMQKVDLIDTINGRRTEGKIIHPNFITNASEDEDDEE